MLQLLENDNVFILNETDGFLFLNPFWMTSGYPF